MSNQGKETRKEVEPRIPRNHRRNSDTIQDEPSIPVDRKQVVRVQEQQQNQPHAQELAETSPFGSVSGVGGEVGSTTDINGGGGADTAARRAAEEEEEEIAETFLFMPVGTNNNKSTRGQTSMNATLPFKITTDGETRMMAGDTFEKLEGGAETLIEEGGKDALEGQKAAAESDTQLARHQRFLYFMDKTTENHYLIQRINSPVFVAGITLLLVTSCIMTAIQIHLSATAFHFSVWVFVGTGVVNAVLGGGLFKVALEFQRDRETLPFSRRSQLARRAELFQLTMILAFSPALSVAASAFSSCESPTLDTDRWVRLNCSLPIFGFTVFLQCIPLLVFRMRVVFALPLILGAPVVYHISREFMGSQEPPGQRGAKGLVEGLQTIVFMMISFVVEQFHRQRFVVWVAYKRSECLASVYRESLVNILELLLPSHSLKQLISNQPAVDVAEHSTISCCTVSDFCVWSTQVMPLIGVEVMDRVWSSFDLILHRVPEWRYLIRRVVVTGDQYIASLGLREEDERKSAIHSGSIGGESNSSHNNTDPAKSGGDGNAKNSGEEKERSSRQIGQHTTRGILQFAMEQRKTVRHFLRAEGVSVMVRKPFSVTIGLASGHSIGAIMGSDRLVYGVQGPALKTAVKLASLASPGTIVADVRTISRGGPLKTKQFVSASGDVVPNGRVLLGMGAGVGQGVHPAATFEGGTAGGGGRVGAATPPRHNSSAAASVQSPTTGSPSTSFPNENEDSPARGSATGGVSSTAGDDTSESETSLQDFVRFQQQRGIGLNPTARNLAHRRLQELTFGTTRRHPDRWWDLSYVSVRVEQDLWRFAAGHGNRVKTLFEWLLWFCAYVGLMFAAAVDDTLTWQTVLCCIIGGGLGMSRHSLSKHLSRLQELQGKEHQQHQINHSSSASKSPNAAAAAASSTTSADTLTALDNNSSQNSGITPPAAALRKQIQTPSIWVSSALRCIATLVHVFLYIVALTQTKPYSMIAESFQFQFFVSCFLVYWGVTGEVPWLQGSISVIVNATNMSLGFIYLRGENESIYAQLPMAWTAVPIFVCALYRREYERRRSYCDAAFCEAQFAVAEAELEINRSLLQLLLPNFVIEAVLRKQRGAIVNSVVHSLMDAITLELRLPFFRKPNLKGGKSSNNLFIGADAATVPRDGGLSSDASLQNNASAQICTTGTFSSASYCPCVENTLALMVEKAHLGFDLVESALRWATDKDGVNSVSSAASSNGAGDSGGGGFSQGVGETTRRRGSNAQTHNVLLGSNPPGAPASVKKPTLKESAGEGGGGGGGQRDADLTILHVIGDSVVLAGPLTQPPKVKPPGPEKTERCVLREGADGEKEKVTLAEVACVKSAIAALKVLVWLDAQLPGQVTGVCTSAVGYASVVGRSHPTFALLGCSPRLAHALANCAPVGYMGATEAFLTLLRNHGVDLSVLGVSLGSRESWRVRGQGTTGMVPLRFNSGGARAAPVNAAAMASASEEEDSEVQFPPATLLVDNSSFSAPSSSRRPNDQPSAPVVTSMNSNPPIANQPQPVPLQQAARPPTVAPEAKPKHQVSHPITSSQFAPHPTPGPALAKFVAQNGILAPGGGQHTEAGPPPATTGTGLFAPHPKSEKFAPSSSATRPFPMGPKIQEIPKWPAHPPLGRPQSDETARNLVAIGQQERQRGETTGGHPGTTNSLQ